METEAKFQYSKAYFKILDIIQSNPEENVFVIRGGQGASKTVSIIQLIIQSLLSSDKEATILSSELSKMKRTVLRDYKKICKDWGVLPDEVDFNRSESKHEYPNGSYLDFLGADVNDIGKGFRRDILYINEADKMDIDTAVQFISRAGLTIIDYNPDSLFWGDEYINDNNFITLTFEDNEFLSKSEVKSILDYKQKGFFKPNLPTDKLFYDANIKNRYWANKWKVYGLGLVGSLDGVIFENWEIINSIPTEAKKIGLGLDFGFTNDPTALVELYQYDRKVIIDELIYEKGMSNSAIANRAKKLEVKRTDLIIADSAEPKSIAEIKSYGLTVKGAEKGKDSIQFGIEVLQEHEILITKTSSNIIREFESYTWDKDRNGATLNVPKDENNHAIDAIRYIAMEKLSNKKKSASGWGSSMG